VCVSVCVCVAADSKPNQFSACSAVDGILLGSLEIWCVQI